MAAGQGFKTFTTGEVLTAADVNGYLMQGVLVFASAAARDAAITSPQEGQFAFTKDTNGLWYYDGAAWVASGATGDIEGVTAGVGISGGGTSGTVTITNSMATEISAKGDLVVGTGSQTFDNLTVGANNTVLTADSSTATGLKWATASTAGPTFYAYLSSNQTVTTNVTTKVQCNTEEYDLGSNYDNATNYRFTPTTAGIYQVNILIQANGSGGTTIWLYKNGSVIREGSRTAGAGAPMGFSTQVTMNGSTDYLEFYANVASGTTVYGGQSTTGFGAAYLRSN